MIPFETLISKAQQDPHLDEKLRAEYEGIFAWAVRGYKIWQDQGIGPIPESVAEMKRDYIETSDTIGEFLSICCTVGAGSVGSGELTTAFHDWCDRESIKRLGRNIFHNYLKEKNFEKQRCTHGYNSGKPTWYGLSLKKKGED